MQHRRLKGITGVDSNGLRLGPRSSRSARAKRGRKDGMARSSDAAGAPGGPSHLTAKVSGQRLGSMAAWRHGPLQPAIDGGAGWPRRACSQAIDRLHRRPAHHRASRKAATLTGRTVSNANQPYRAACGSTHAPNDVQHDWRHYREHVRCSTPCKCTTTLPEPGQDIHPGAEGDG